MDSFAYISPPPWQRPAMRVRSRRRTVDARGGTGHSESAGIPEGGARADRPEGRGDDLNVKRAYSSLNSRAVCGAIHKHSLQKGERMYCSVGANSLAVGLQPRCLSPEISNGAADRLQFCFCRGGSIPNRSNLRDCISERYMYSGPQQSACPSGLLLRAQQGARTGRVSVCVRALPARPRAGILAETDRAVAETDRV